MLSRRLRFNPNALSATLRVHEPNFILACSSSAHSQPPFVTLVRQMKIYTRTGDKGTSSLFNGERRPKTDPSFEALGDIDELNSVVGVASQFCPRPSLDNLHARLQEIQMDLFDVGTAVATPLGSSSEQKLERAKFPEKTYVKLETWIDEMDVDLPPLTNFILPGGGLLGSHLHLARSACRRAERHVLPLVTNAHVEPSVSVYLNRLSDFFFAAARYACVKTQDKEVVYKKRATTPTSLEQQQQ
eukprot:c8417_g1_i1.p1 GENE.c8417_g1_i1~~c8417_g1_i1.p1  ORF type:complete len:244 (-),score=59.76 c8417_g1_i1:228-959(-)